MKHSYYFGLFLFLPQFLSAQINLQITTTNINCFGGASGAAQVAADGGTLPYSYNWNNGGQTNAITGLSIGAYTVTVSDSQGASATKSAVITQPPLLGVTLNGQPQICSVAPDGFTYAIPTGGTPPCTYNWSNNVTTQLNNHLVANVYSVTITDTKGCNATGSYTVGFLGLGLYLFTDSEPATCPQPFNGSATTTALSGNGPYQYLWSNGSSSSDIDNLTAGEYVVTVSDINGCSATKSAIVELENVDPNVVQVLIPQCTGETYSFISSPDYQAYNWTPNDPRDSIISGFGTSQVLIKWGTAGQKELTVTMSDSLTQCLTATQFKVTVYNCSSSAAEEAFEQYIITPNPFSQFIDIQGTHSENAAIELQLCNLSGQVVKSQLIGNNNTRINTTDVLPGVYFLKMSDGSSSKVKKAIKYH